MQVGLYCSSNRPHLWGDLYEMLSRNNVDFNLCIAGPNSPVDPLPGNVKYIQTTVKPAQCFFIASQNIVGDYIMNIPDDMRFTHGCLDDLVKLSDKKMTIASARMLVSGEKVNHYIWADKRIPKDLNGKRKFIDLGFPLPAGPMMRRETFDQSAGIDKEYVALYWDQDIVFELISKGAKVIISETSTNDEIKGGKVCLSRISCDYLYLMDMWFDGDNIRNKRKKPVDSLYYSADVLKVSQGKKDPGQTGKAAKKIIKVVSTWT